MIGTPERASLVIADIAGYTGYLAGVELDHAQDILADLISTVVDSLRPTFRLAKLEGDAAFAYAITEKVDPSLVQDTVEGTYFAFRRRLRDIGQASRCECNACIRIPTLDLKVVVHQGTIVRQRVAGREELVGADVIVVHRLLKNGIEAALGVHAYAGYTQACIDAMAADPVRMGLAEHVETTDVAGEITIWVRDLEAAWRAEQERARVEITKADAAFVLAVDIAAPPALVWEYVTSPVRRPQWGIGIDAIDEATPTGRRGTGTVNHCIHGRDAIVEEILDWRPIHYWTVRSTLPAPGRPKVTMTDALIPIADGTRLEVRVGKPRPRERKAMEQLWPMYDELLRGSLASLTAAAEADAAQRAQEAAEEPLVPRGGIPDPISATA